MATADASRPETAGAGASPPGARWALGLATAVLWFFLAGLSTVISQAASAAFHGDRSSTGGAAFLLGILSVVVLLAPALPLTAWWGRERLAYGAALAAFAAGIVHAGLDAPYRSVAGMIAFAAAAFFLVATVGLANRRAIAGGFAGAFVLRELIQQTGWRSAGSGSPTAILIAAAIAAFGVWSLYRWRRAPNEDRGDSFERRAGGLRLRGALALGAILFFELSYGIGLRNGLGPAAAAASIAGATAAWLLIVRGFHVQRHRTLAVSLAVLTTICAVGAQLPGLADWGTVVALVVAHAAALLLLDRALAPVSGRRSGGNLAIGLLLLAVLSFAAAIGWAIAGDNAAGPVQSAGWAVVAGAVLVASMHLTPRPPLAPPALPYRVALPLALAIPLATALLKAL